MDNWLTYSGHDWLTYNGYDWLIHTYLDYNKNQVISELRVANKDDSVSKNDPMGKYLFSKILGWYDYSIWDGVV